MKVIVAAWLLCCVILCKAPVNSLYGMAQSASTYTQPNNNQFYYRVAANDAHTVSSSYQSVDLGALSAHQLRNYFAHHQWSEDDILSDPRLYASNDYLTIAKQLPTYSLYVKKHYEHYVGYDTSLKKAWGRLSGVYSVSLAQLFEHLHGECERQKQQLHDHNMQQKNLAKVVYNNFMYQQKLVTLEHTLLNNSETFHRQERLNPLHKTHNNGGQRVHRVVPVDQKIYDYAQAYDIPESAFAPRAMNDYEYQLHTEFIEQLTAAEQLAPVYGQAEEYTVFLDMVAHSVACGMEANEQHDAATATYWCDVAWQALDLAHAVGEGLVLGVYNTATSIGHIASWSAGVVGHPLESTKKVICCMEKVVSSLANGIANIAECDRDSFLNIDQKLEICIGQINGVIDHCSEQLAQMPLREKVKHVTAFGTEIIIPGKAFKIVHKLCSRMKPVAMGLFHTLHNEQKAVQIAACAEGVAGNMGMAVIEGAQAGAARAVLNEAQLLLQNFHIDLMTKLEPEIAVLKVVFDNRVKGFGEFANKYIKIDYEHILGMDLSFSKRGILQIGGFHHGFMHVVKKSNMFEFVDEVIHASGFYKAKVFHKGYFVKEITFFPADWSREKVINSIHEAYDSFIKSGMAPFVESNGKYRIEGYTKNGIQVRMYITKKGLITTVYPLLP